VKKFVDTPELTSRPVDWIPGTVASTLPYPREAGISWRTSFDSTTWRLVLVWTSTAGVSPTTVIVSETAPTRMSALILVTPPPVTSTASRMTVVNPWSVNVTLYMPGGRSVMRYRPVESLVADRTFSISTGLVASTLTPGSTAPDASLTTPDSVAWANPIAGKITNAARAIVTRASPRMQSPSPQANSCQITGEVILETTFAGVNTSALEALTCEWSNEGLHARGDLRCQLPTSNSLR
jgi:hypothetical protein